MNNELLNQQFYRKLKRKQIRPMFKYMFNSVSKLKDIIVTDKLQFYILLQEVKVFQTTTLLWSLHTIYYYVLHILYRIPPAMQEMRIWSLGQKDPLEKEMVTHYSILAWEIPWIEGPWQASVHGVAKKLDTNFAHN